ncbi:hypothetical protein C8Q76DRAFT_601016, partial [Earliella scabrosa]
FPPKPLSQELEQEVIAGFAKDIQIENFLESACAVCGLLTPKSTLEKIDQCELD